MFYESLRPLLDIDFNCLQLYLATQCVREGVQLTDLSPRSTQPVTVGHSVGDLDIDLWRPDDNQMRHRSWFGGGGVGRLASRQGEKTVTRHLVSSWKWSRKAGTRWAKELRCFFVKKVTEMVSSLSSDITFFSGGLCAAGAQFPTTAASLYARRFTGTLEHLGTLWWRWRIWFRCGKIKWEAACMILCVFPKESWMLAFFDFQAYPILRHTELELFDLCPKAAGTSFGNSGLWPRAIWTSPCPMEVAKSLASYTSQLGFWNIRNVSEPQLARVEKAVEVFVLHLLVTQHVMWCRLFFSARPPCGQPQTALTIRRLLWSQEVQRPPSTSGLLWPKTSSDNASSARSRAALILQQFVYHNRERMGVGFSQVCMVVRCGDAQEATCCECFACDGGGPSWNFLSCRFWQGVYSVRNARYRLLFRVDKAPPAMVGCGHTHWHWLLQYAQKRHATETLWGSRSGECGWRRCCFRTEKAESSTVRLVPGGSCDGLQAVLVRDDALDLTLSSSGFGTFQLEAVMFRNPNWFVYRTPLRSSFCTCLSLSMSSDVVCFFSPRPPCGQPQTALTIRRLLWSQEVQRPPSTSGLLWPKTSSDNASSARSRAALILQQFVYHNRERMGVGFSQVCMVVRCGDAQQAACCECFACDGGGSSWNLLSCRFWQGVYSVRNARYRLLFRVDKAPPAMVGCGHTHWHRLLQYAQKRHATETLWGSRSGECGWRRCCFRTEKAESSTVRLVPGGSCDGLQAVLVRDDALDLTLSSSGFGTFQLEAVMFRNPNWFVYRTPLRSSFCTCLSLSMSSDVVCFFSARPPCGQPQTALTIRRLLWSQEVQRPPSTSGLLWPKTSSDKASSARSRAALILQQFVYHNRERMGVGFSQVCMVVRCGDAQQAACCECFACDGGGSSWNLLSCRFWQGVYSVRNARYYRLLFRVDKAPPAMVGCGHTHWHRLLQYAQKRHATETLWGSRSGEWPSFSNEVVGFAGCTAWWVYGEGCLSCHATICQMFSKSLLRLGTAVGLRAQWVFIPLVNIAIGTALTNTFRVRGVSQKTSELLPRFTFHFWQEEDLDMFVKWVCLKMGYTPNEIAASHLVGIMIINHWV